MDGTSQQVENKLETTPNESGSDFPELFSPTTIPGAPRHDCPQSFLSYGQACQDRPSIYPAYGSSYGQPPSSYGQACQGRPTYPPIYPPIYPTSSYGQACQGRPTYPPTSSYGPDPDRSHVIVMDLDKLKPLNQIRRVPPHFKHKKAQELDVYHPIIISLGPYHHGKPEYRHAEYFKQVSLSAFLSESSVDEDKFFFYRKILERISEVRNCYEDVEYDNEALAWLMLRDSCFFIYAMELASSFLSEADVTAYYSYFGIGAMNFIGRDLLLLENQIPFWIIKLLICLRSSQGHSVWKKLLVGHMNRASSMQLETLPWENEEYEPFHFLDAVRYYHMIPVKALDERNTWKTPMNSADEIYRETNYQFRSVTDLKAKGIRFKPSSTQYSISFTSHAMGGQLTLPPINLSINFFVLYSNFIAYEIFPTSNAKLYATAFVNFMKALIETPNDVKILREEGIIFGNIGSDIEVVKVVKDLHTFGVERSGVFMELRTSITNHCCSKARTWKAELIHIYFRSPWSTIAVFAASTLLLLTFLQTYFTVRPHI